MDIENKKRVKKVYRNLESIIDELEEVKEEEQEYFDEQYEEEYPNIDKGKFLDEKESLESGIAVIEDALAILDEITRDFEYEEKQEKQNEEKQEIVYEESETDLIPVSTNEEKNDAENDENDETKSRYSSYVLKAKQLKKNIKILASSFETYKVDVLQIGCKPYSENMPGALAVFVEINANKKVKEIMRVGLNIYDKDDELIDSVYEEIYDGFIGYTTMKIQFHDEDFLDKAVSGKLYFAPY